MQEFAAISIPVKTFQINCFFCLEGMISFTIVFGSYLSEPRFNNSNKEKQCLVHSYEAVKTQVVYPACESVVECHPLQRSGRSETGSVIHPGVWSMETQTNRLVSHSATPALLHVSCRPLTSGCLISTSSPVDNVTVQAQSGIQCVDQLRVAISIECNATVEMVC